MLTVRYRTLALVMVIPLLLVAMFFVGVRSASALTDNCFTDVTTGMWFHDYVCWMFDAGLTTGYPDGTYRPYDNITRAEVAVMMQQISGAGSVGPVVDADKIDGLEASAFYTQAEVDALLVSYNSRITALEDLLASVSTENSGQDVVFTGVNLHIRSGSGVTGGAINGLGNLIIGYNEDLFAPTATRTGSHNLVVGSEHSYSSYGGFLAGYQNTVSERYASVIGGRENTASGINAAISGGMGNTASGSYASICGGENNTASGIYSSVSAGGGNTASGSNASVSGGVNNTAIGAWSSVSGGVANSASSNWSSVSGGVNNTTSGNYASISGGSNNTASGSYASVNGGRYNTASGLYSTVLGGGGINSTFGNDAWAYYSVIAGGAANVAGNDSGTDRSVGQASAVLAGYNNNASDDYASVCAGHTNTASGLYSSVSGGLGNTASGSSASASGGINNTASGLYSSVSGGVLNSANGDWSSISGGVTNTASGPYSSVSAGEDNTAGGSYASVSGGLNNSASGEHSTVSGGANDSVSGGADWRAGDLFQEN